MTITMTSYSSDGKCGTWDAPFSTEEAEKVRTFHKTLDGYAKTPLRNLAKTAKILGLKGLTSRMKVTVSASMPSRDLAEAMPC